jgi:hypothetical protein
MFSTLDRTSGWSASAEQSYRNNSFNYSSKVFFAKTQKILRFDALIEKKDFVQAQKSANTPPHNSTQRLA